MNIVMLTNTYLPHVGGVANSVQRLSEQLRAWKHRVIIIAPEFDELPENETDVYRVPALQNFNGSDFSVVLPVPKFLSEVLEEFGPDLIHSHHPFLLGDTALRLAASHGLPLVFTHHTMYEQYTHYVPLDALQFGDFVKSLATGYANQCHRVVAPSESVASILKERGVETPIRVIPTGVDTHLFEAGEGAAVRKEAGIPQDAFVVGHVGRLAEEKNLLFLAQATAAFLQAEKGAYTLIVGEGPAQEEMQRIFDDQGVADRAKLIGKRQGQAVIDAYHAMDVFAFSSYSETQGMVLVEAMAAGVPVVALKAPGAVEVIQDKGNGRLLPEQDADAFREALVWMLQRDEAAKTQMAKAVAETAEAFSTETCVGKMVALYENVIFEHAQEGGFVENEWQSLLNSVREEYTLWSNRATALGEALWKAEAPE
jgi:glycosyltransferase involved in cell wall biosynthesis